MDLVTVGFVVSVIWFMTACHTVGQVLQKDIPQHQRCPTAKTQNSILTDVLTAGMPQSLQDFIASSAAPTGKIKHRIQVSPGVHVFVGHGYANCVVLDAPLGLIVIDTLIGSDLANPVINQIREEINTNPFKALIYTNMRPDHVGGAKAFVDSQPGQAIDVWSYRRLTNEFWDQWTFVKPAATLRKYREKAGDFPGMKTYNKSMSDGSDVPRGVLEVPANRFIGQKKVRADIAGLLLELYPLPGPSESEIGVYLRKTKVLIIGDLFNNRFPMIYPIDGETPLTNIQNWINSLNSILDMDVEVLASANSEPITGKEAIRDRILQYVRAMKFLHDQTMRWINRGFHPQEIAHAMTLPTGISQSPDLREFHGTIEWSIKGIYQSVFGWFNGFPEALFPLTQGEQALRWQELVSRKRLLTSAKQAVKKGTLNDLKWAVQVTSLLHHLVNDMNEDFMQVMAKTRNRAFIKLAELQSSQTARNYLLRLVLEESCLVNNSSPVFSDTEAVLYLPIDHLIAKMCAMLKAEDVEGVDKSVVLIFTDIKRSFNMRLQNSVLDVNRGRIKDSDLQIEMNATSFRQVLLRRLSFEEAEARVLPNITYGYEFLGYFDDPSMSFFH